MSYLGLQPSFSLGYAKSAEESENPELWKDAVYMICPALGFQGRKAHDLSGNGINGSLGSAMNYGLGRYGHTLKGVVSNSNSYVDLGVDSIRPNSENWPGFTLFVGVKWPLTGTVPAMVSSVIPGGFTGNFLFTQEQDNFLRLRCGDGDIDTVLAGLVTGAEYDFACRWDKSKQWVFSGGEIAAGPRGNTLNWTTASTQNYVGYYTRIGNRSFGGPIHYAYLYKTPKSDSFIKRLSRDPLAPFRLNEIQRLFVQSSGTPAFNPAWALGPESVIGGPVFA